MDACSGMLLNLLFLVLPPVSKSVIELLKHEIEFSSFSHAPQKRWIQSEPCRIEIMNVENLMGYLILLKVMEE